MAKIVDFDSKGHIIYHGMLSEQEVDSYDEVIRVLQSEFPLIENELKEKYPNRGGTSWEYKYYIGEALGSYLDKYEVTEDERRRFFDEIKNLASEDKRTRDEGKKAKTRSFFEQCYLFSKIDINTVPVLNWGEWQTLLDRTSGRDDVRIFKWIGTQKDKINRRTWRSFMKALNLYYKKIDTSVFSEGEVFDIWDSLLMMGTYWVEEYDKFKSNHKKSVKSTHEREWSVKFFQKSLEMKKQNGVDIVTKEICSKAFQEVMFS